MSEDSSDDETPSVIRELKARIKFLEEELARKSGLLTQVQTHFEALEEEIEDVKCENSAQKAKIQELERSSASSSDRIQTEFAKQDAVESEKPNDKSTTSDNDSENGSSESEENDAEDDADDEDFDLSTKLNTFLKLWKGGKLTKHEFLLHSVNAFMTLYHLMFSKEELTGEQLISLRKNEGVADSNQMKASKVAVHYTLEFLKQLMDPRVHIDDDVDEESEEAEERKENQFTTYPMQWLLSMFPFIPVSSKEGSTASPSVDGNAFLPLHIMLALDTTHLPYSDYLSDLRLLIQQHKASAFQEEVSPLCVAVAKKCPNIEAVQLLLELHPTAVSTEDEDGSLAVMHACSYNTHTDVIDLLVKAYPASLKKGDNFGCCAIHYAAFSGYSSSVAYLLETLPECASQVEGNGALALHDAVQNCRLSSEDPLDASASQDVLQMVEMLLAANPRAASTRDDFGAFPLHKAAKCATLEIVQIVYEAFPKAIFAVDKEGLLPMHYYAQREKKNIEVVQFILRFNPNSIQVEEAHLDKFVDPNAAPAVAPAAASQTGTWRDRMKAMWSGATAAPAAAAAPHAATVAAPVPKGGAGGAKVNRRKSSVIGKNGVHNQYKR